MAQYPDLPDSIVTPLRAACAHLPEAEEQQAYEGVRWRIRGATLAHARTHDHEGEPIVVLTVHAADEDIESLVAAGDPFFPGWGGGLLAIVLRDDGTTDWGEIAELVTESYRRLAPKKLIARLDAEWRR